MIVKEKIAQAKRLLEEFDLECWITFVRESQINGDPTLTFLAATDVTWHSAFIISRDGRTRAIVGQYDVPAIEQLGAYDNVVGFVQGISDPLQAYLLELNPSTIAINYSTTSEICDGLTYGMYLALRDLLAEIDMADRLVSAERLVSAFRERKTVTELQCIQQAVAITEQIWDATTRYLKPGLTEREIGAFMQQEARERKVGLAWSPSSCPGVFAGVGLAEAHNAPTDKLVERGELLNMDFGVRFNNYVSDTQRTYYVLDGGERSAPPDVQHGFDTIVTAVEQAKRAIRPGIEAWEVDAIARQIVVEAGFAEFPHGLGHQLGVYAHDGTALLGPKWEKYADKPLRRLEENMVFTIEPRCTVSGRGVVTIEEMVRVTADGASWLTTPQKELLLIA